MQRRRVLTLLALAALSASGASLAAGPPLRVFSDGFPSGHGAPEGAACDLQRSLMKGDAALFQATCLPPFGGGPSRRQYAASLKQTVATLRAQRRAVKGSGRLPGRPRGIAKVYAARAFSRNGPASYGKAAFGFQDVRFVDVGMDLGQGVWGLNRILVIRAGNGRWYVHPLPQIHPLLNAMNEEEASTQDFSQVYTLLR